MILRLLADADLKSAIVAGVVRAVAAQEGRVQWQEIDRVRDGQALGNQIWASDT